MLFLSKEVTSKDQQLKTQRLISLKDNESKKAETVSKGNGFFDEHTSDLTITRPNFPENIGIRQSRFNFNCQGWTCNLS